MHKNTDFKAIAIRLVGFPVYLYLVIGVIFSAYELSICFNFFEWNVFSRVLFSTTVSMTSGITIIGVLSGNFEGEKDA